MIDTEQHITRFVDTLGFTPDPFQRRAIDALVAGRSVLVAAPTGAGKTVVGEFACHDALTRGDKAFYTTPIKALSNQKYRDLVERYGDASVGLLTGDRSINGDAPIVVMTTEVLRNMIYERSRTLDGLRHVVLDEVHYLADRSRGAVWEEVIIQVAASVQIAALSATVSNAEDFGRWLDTVRDGCDVVIEESRPVPLKHHYFVNDVVYDTFRAGRKQGASKEHRERAAQALAGVPNPEVMMLERRARQRNRVTNKGRRMGPDVRLRWPSRPHVIAELDARGWLPAIQFVFSRKGCEDAVEQLTTAGVRLTTAAERREIATLVDTLLADLPPADLEVLGVTAFRSALIDGIAAHHAGLVPAFKECVELLFQRGLLKLVVATETLALGINMPARTVIIERLEKWNGESHVLLTPGEYTQLTGRAGRRGIDTVGHAVVLYQRDLDFRTVAGLVGTRAYPLRSSFAPSYNMAVNLLRRHDLEQAEALLAASFAQFEADASVGRLGEELAEAERGLEGYARHLTCDAGDWAAYWALRRDVSRLEKEQAAARRAAAAKAVRDGIAALRPGDVLHIPRLGRRGLVAVTGVHVTRKGTPLAQAVTDDRALVKLGPRELDGAPAVVEQVRLPTSGNPRQQAYRREVAHALRGLEPPAVPLSELTDDAATGNRAARHTAADDAAANDSIANDTAAHGAAANGAAANGAAAHDTAANDAAANDAIAPDSAAPDGTATDAAAQIDQLRHEIRAHPCHHCPDRETHETWQHRTDELFGDTDRLRHRIDRTTGSLARQLHRILAVLTDLGYVDETPDPTPDGLRLAGIYCEVDLLVAEALRRGLLDGLQAPEVAAIAALFLYEPRGGEPTERVVLPTLEVEDTVDDILLLAEELRAREEAAGVRSTLRDLDAGFVGPAYRWASGEDLDAALGDLELTGGDFVRNVKQIADLVGQIRGVAGPGLRGEAELALDGLRRGIVDA